MTITSKNEPYTVVFASGDIEHVQATTPKQAISEAQGRTTGYDLSVIGTFRGYHELCNPDDDEPFGYGAPVISTGQQITFEELVQGNLGDSAVLLSGYLDREPAAFLATFEPSDDGYLIAPIAVMMNPLIEKLARDPTGEPLKNLQEAETGTNIGGHGT